MLGWQRYKLRTAQLTVTGILSVAAEYNSVLKQTSYVHKEKRNNLTIKKMLLFYLYKFGFFGRKDKAAFVIFIK